MFQKFYTDTLGSRFIKSLLSQTPIPLFDCVVEKDNLISGTYYVYKHFIIKCVTSGMLLISDDELLYPSNTLYPSEFLVPDTGYIPARFYVVSYVFDYNKKTHSAFKSSTTYYDSETHYYLSKYLRYIHSTTGLDLFPYYNCYNSTYFSDVELSVGNHADNGSVSRTVDISRTSTPHYKVVAIPIMFGKTYTIAIDCPTQVLMRACIHDNSGYVDEEKFFSNYESNDLLNSFKTELKVSGKVYPCLKFSSPETFRIDAYCPEAALLQHNLYLLIQLPLNNDSSIVVLENYKGFKGVKCNSDSVREITNINSSLLKMNTKTSYAFSDRLFEYLIGNTISTNTTNMKDIAKIQTSLCKMFPEYSRRFLNGTYKKGVWNTDTSHFIYCLIENEKNNSMLYDQDGYVNRDVEMLLNSKGVIVNV